MESFNNWLNKIFSKRVPQRVFTMLVFTILNIAVTLIAVFSLGYQLGWQKLTEFPFTVLWLYVFVFGLMAIALGWGEIKEDEREKQKTLDTLTELTKAINDLIKKIDEKFDTLIDEIRRDRDERNNKPK